MSEYTTPDEKFVAMRLELTNLYRANTDLIYLGTKFRTLFKKICPRNRKIPDTNLTAHGGTDSASLFVISQIQPNTFNKRNSGRYYECSTFISKFEIPNINVYKVTPTLAKLHSRIIVYDKIYYDPYNNQIVFGGIHDGIYEYQGLSLDNEYSMFMLANEFVKHFDTMYPVVKQLHESVDVCITANKRLYDEFTTYHTLTKLDKV
ncbi:hypothetical protein HNP86_001826 [Methanococcus maripaludis]|uniref:Uncharacterized protein n=1 Tax=Methanococcus maripaludis TaxID=39152 RepID=A0A7J9NWG6_METMI|nr:hypothetical protein [Methanococcus maripaludis]MBA2851667.1 hypothetical protein [Methanococcus maripaludis]